MAKFYKKMVVCLAMAMATVTCFSFVGCGKLEAPKTNNVIPEYNQDLSMMIFADRPPKFKEEYLIDYKNAGFTHYVMTEDHAPLTNADGVFGNADDDVVSDEYKSAFDVCDEVGLKTIVRNMRNDPNYFVNTDDSVRYHEPPFDYSYQIPVRSLSTEITSLKNLEGFFMCDEPSYSKISTLTPLVEWYNQNVTDGLFHMNLNPSSSTFMFSGHTYEEYIQHYIDTILSNVNGKKTLSIDRYPLKEQNRTGELYVDEGFLYDYTVVAEKVKQLKTLNPSNADNIITNFYIQAYKDTGVRMLSCVEEIRWLTNIALTFGAESLGYYLYYSLLSDDGIVEFGTHRKLPLYDFVRQVNQEIQNTADAILNFDWNGVKTYKGSQITTERNAQAFDRIKNKALTNFALIRNVESRLDTVVSEFKDKNDNKAYAVMNYSEPTKGQLDIVKVEFGALINKAVIYIKGVKRVVDVENNKLSIELGAGEMAFVYPVYEN